MTDKRVLKLLDISTRGSQLHVAYDFDGYRFANTIWYDGVTFEELEQTYGARAIRNIAFHIAAFEINKICSLRPDILDWGDYAEFATDGFEELWRTIFENVWAQWRFENEDYEYLGPEFAPRTSSESPVISSRSPDGYLLFFGGGKDSLVSLSLVDRLAVPFASLTYSASFYGTSEDQHRLIGKLLDSYGVEKRRRQWVFDDFLDSPALQLSNPAGVRTLTAAETPSSIFGALPYILQENYRFITLAHERSADAPQAFFPGSKEPVNHQWGKSYEAEVLLNSYIQKTLIEDFEYFSILKPIYDLSIFNYLRKVESHVPFTHSCNIRKPWCRRCAKCLYVWIGYTAFLDRETVVQTFGEENLYDVPENEELFRQLTGLGEQLPFECIGEADEAALMMAMARRRGWSGRAIDACDERLSKVDWRATAEKYLNIDSEEFSIPQQISDALDSQLAENRASAMEFISATMS